MVEKIKALPNTGFAPNNKAIAAHLRQQAEWIEAKIEALEEAADRLERIAGEEGFYSNHVQTHDDDVKELRRMAADLQANYKDALTKAREQKHRADD